MLSKIQYLMIWLIMIDHLAVRASGCRPSSCGKIGNINPPFRLKGDPKHCGNGDYELICENNTTAYLYFLSHKYRVEAINYSNFTIRLRDPSINGNNTCSFPDHSLSGSDFPIHEYPYSIQTFRRSMSESRSSISTSITFMSCPYPVSIYNYPLLLDISRSCADTYTHTYIKAGVLNSSYVPEMCTVEMIAMSSSPALNGDERVSLSDIHNSLVYGFELSWFIALCDRHCVNCWLVAGKQTQCEYSCSIAFWEIPCGGMPFWFSIALSASTWIIELAIEHGVRLYLAIRIIIGIPCVAVFLIYKLRRRRFSAFNNIEGFLQNNNNLVPIRYSYSDIKKMTRNFREELGKGGYGSVYRGKLRSGHEVAVKMLCKTKENGQDFINEVATIGRIHHVNIVKLVGYCVESSKYALVYDLMSNGSLEKYIFDRPRSNYSLSWERKYEIAVGVARGIEYLHKGCDVQILHFDIKPHNILLDEDFTPKISDFGLAKFFSVEKNVVTLTAARGTIGYVAPELINRSIGEVSYKADVYSFGMLLMEMVGLNRDKAPDNENCSQYFPFWIYDRINKGKEIQAGNIDDSGGDGECARKIKQMTVVGLWCIQMNPVDRPSMSGVLKMLEGGNENLQIPPYEMNPVDRPSMSGVLKMLEGGNENLQIPPYEVCDSSLNEPFNDKRWETESIDSVSLLCSDSLSIEIR